MLDWLEWLSIATSTLLGWVTLVSVIMGALWAGYTFWANTRAKHAELLLKLEESYRSHVPTLLKLEYLRQYESTFVSALELANRTTEANRKGIGYSKSQSKAIDALELSLRHFLMASHLRALGVARREIDNMHAYYLRLFTNEDHEELRIYLRRYWSRLYFWSYLAGRPWFVRWPVFLRQIPDRLTVWAFSRASEPDRARRSGDPGPLATGVSGSDTGEVGRTAREDREEPPDPGPPSGMTALPRH